MHSLKNTGSLKQCLKARARLDRIERRYKGVVLLGAESEFRAGRESFRCRFQPLIKNEGADRFAFNGGRSFQNGFRLGRQADFEPIISAFGSAMHRHLLAKTSSAL